MMSGHDPNTIVFKNKKIKTRHPEHSLTPHPLHPITSHFWLTPLHTAPTLPSNLTSYVYHLLCLYVQQHPYPEM